jgi:hypothetical protein
MGTNLHAVEAGPVILLLMRTGKRRSASAMMNTELAATGPFRLRSSRASHIPGVQSNGRRGDTPLLTKLPISNDCRAQLRKTKSM